MSRASRTAGNVGRPAQDKRPVQGHRGPREGRGNIGHPAGGAVWDREEAFSILIRSPNDRASHPGNRGARARSAGRRRPGSLRPPLKSRAWLLSRIAAVVADMPGHLLLTRSRRRGSLLNHLVGDGKELRRHVDAERTWRFAG